MSNRKIYREIAKKHGVSVAEVKRDMQSAINHAYQNNTDLNVAKKQNEIKKNGEIPTACEFLAHAKKNLR